ncbi:MAG: lipoyl(octanoyl) transferase LipB [Nostocaceae cyanobacterium]|nr:lipoyl(octanoyl) transferase LipB [Nostocaceae cyanobacterium]
MPPLERQCWLNDCPGLIPYTEALAWQRSLLNERVNNPNLDDVLILLEHPPVYTLKKGGKEEYYKNLDQNKHEVVEIQRGGEVTYHCPGQIVGYPILNLKYHRQDLHWYLRQLETVLIQTLKSYDLPAESIPGLTGVWIEGKKVAAIGIKVKHWITMHGFALNVNPDLTGFQQIIPCGIADKPVASLTQWLPEITPQEIRPKLAQNFAQLFNLHLTSAPHRARSTAPSAFQKSPLNIQPTQKPP